MRGAVVVTIKQEGMVAENEVFLVGHRGRGSKATWNKAMGYFIHSIEFAFKNADDLSGLREFRKQLKAKTEMTSEFEESEDGGWHKVVKPLYASEDEWFEDIFGDGLYELPNGEEITIAWASVK
jgi:hypothetical protein